MSGWGTSTRRHLMPYALFDGDERVGEPVMTKLEVWQQVLEAGLISELPVADEEQEGPGCFLPVSISKKSVASSIRDDGLAVDHEARNVSDRSFARRWVSQRGGQGDAMGQITVAASTPLVWSDRIRPVQRIDGDRAPR